MLLFGVVPFSLVFYAGFKYSDGIILGTGIAIVWYSVETMYLRRETVRQNEIAVRPLVIVKVEGRQLGLLPTPDFGPQLVARNVGNGLAILIRLRDMELVDPAGDKVRFTARFDTLSHLERSQESPVRVQECVPVDARVKQEHLDAVTCLDPQYAVASYTMRIEYEDILGCTHWTEIKMGKDGVQLLGHS